MYSYIHQYKSTNHVLPITITLKRKSRNFSYRNVIVFLLPVNKVFFFIGNQFCSFKTRLSVFKSNFKKRSFPWQHRALSMETSPNPRGPEKREV
jgi:hypothetical protein